MKSRKAAAMIAAAVMLDGSMEAGRTPDRGPVEIARAAEARDFPFLRGPILGCSTDMLESAIKASWSAETSGCRPSSIYRDYMDMNPSLGQCVPTALVIQDYRGGALIISRFHLFYDEYHLFNRLDDGTFSDLTRLQFRRRPYPRGITLSAPEEIDRRRVLTRAGNLDRYVRLRCKVDDALERMLRRT